MILAGAGLLWRVHAFEDPRGAGMIVPVVGVLASLAFTLTGLAMLAGQEETDVQSGSSR